MSHAAAREKQGLTRQRARSRVSCGSAREAGSHAAGEFADGVDGSWTDDGQIRRTGHDFKENRVAKTILKETALREAILKDAAFRDTSRVPGSDFKSAAPRDANLKETALRETDLRETANQQSILKEYVSGMRF